MFGALGGGQQRSVAAKLGRPLGEVLKKLADVRNRLLSPRRRVSAGGKIEGWATLILEAY